MSSSAAWPNSPIALYFLPYFRLKGMVNLWSKLYKQTLQYAEKEKVAVGIDIGERQGKAACCYSRSDMK